MTTSTTPTTSSTRTTEPARSDGRGIRSVRVVDGGLRQDLRGVKVVWQRELLRFGQDRIRIVAFLVQPILFLFVLGTGLSSLTDASTGGVDLRTFMFPGVLATSVLFTAMFSAASVVWDREFGFLREMLVAPVRRGSIIVGKALGGATVATLQSLVILALAGTVGVPYNPVMIVIAASASCSCSRSPCTSIGLVIAARVQQMQAMMGVMQMLVLPLSFLSGALYPISNLPTWLEDAHPAQPGDLRRARDPQHGVRLPRRPAGGAGSAQPADRVVRLDGADGRAARHRRRASASRLLAVATAEFNRVE